MKLEIAGPSQSASLVEFYKGFSTQGLVRMKIDRGQNFFKPYDLQSDRHITYIMQDEESGKVEGSASFVINNVLLEGQVMSVAFGRDLRISSNRKAILSWAHHFLPTMDAIEKK